RASGLLDPLNHKLMLWRPSGRDDIETSAAPGASKFHVAELNSLRVEPLGTARASYCTSFPVGNAQFLTADVARCDCQFVTPFESLTPSGNRNLRWRRQDG